MTKAVTVSKRDFVITYQEVRDRIAKELTIQHAWQKNGLFPLKPEIVLDKIKKREAGKDKEKAQLITLPEVFYVLSTGAKVSAQVQTPSSIIEVNQIIDRIKLGTHTELELKKLSNATHQAFARNTTLEITNKALLEKDNEMKKQVQHSKKQLGKGQIMGQEVLEERKVVAQLKKDKKDYWDTWTDVVYLLKDAEQEAIQRNVAIVLRLQQEEKEQ